VTPADVGWADVVAISSTTSTAPRSYRVADAARAAGKKVVMGGPHVTFLPEEALAHADYVVRGEGDLTLPELARELENRGELSSIQGLSFGDPRAPIHNEARPFVEDLGADSLDTVELVMALEDEFECEIPDEEAEKIRTVQQAIEYVTTHLKKA